MVVSSRAAASTIAAAPVAILKLEAQLRSPTLNLPNPQVSEENSEI